SPPKGLLKKGVAACALVAEGVHATVTVDGEDGQRHPLSTPLRITNDTIARSIVSRELQTSGRAIQP
ncbi:MAG TPA: hypothetical protein VM053_05855, partial [Gemmatimonadaceae bacterium]|nr:hypothetical protein [Gemmatimonadaceae bacterium]